MRQSPCTKLIERAIAAADDRISTSYLIPRRFRTIVHDKRASLSAAVPRRSYDDHAKSRPADGGSVCVRPRFHIHRHAADYAPLDCKKATSDTERTVCSNYKLGQSEARAATLYEVTTSLVAMGQRGTIQDDQRALPKQRDACGLNIGCIRNAYSAREKQLEAVMAGIRQRGPF